MCATSTRSLAHGNDIIEIGRPIAEHELQLELLHDSNQGQDRIGLLADARHHDAAAARSLHHALSDEAWHADALEDHVGSAACNLVDLRRKRLGRIDRVGCAEPGRHLPSNFGLLAYNDVAGTQEIRPQHRGEPDRPRADDQHGGSARHLRHIDGVQSNGERLDHCSFLETDARGKSIGAAGTNANELRIAAGALSQADREHFRASSAQSEIDAGRVIAATDDGISCNPFTAFPKMRHGFSDFDDLARELVAHDTSRGQWHGRSRLCHMQIRAANAAIAHLENNVVRTADRIGNRLDHQRLRGILEHSGSHQRFPSWSANSLDTCRRRLCHSCAERTRERR